MSIENSIKKSMAAMISRIQGEPDVAVTSWDEEYNRFTYGGCETCGPEYEDEYEVTMYYYTPGSNKKYFTYKGKFTDLIKELDTE